MIGQENISRLLWGGSGVSHGLLYVPISVFSGGKPLSACPHLRQRGSSVPDASVAPHGVHQRVGGEGVVGGARAHILLEAHDDGPIGSEGVEVQHVSLLRSTYRLVIDQDEAQLHLQSPSTCSPTISGSSLDFWALQQAVLD